AERVATRLARETGIPLSRSSASEPETAQLLIRVEGAAGGVQGLGEEESYTLEITNRQAVLHSLCPYGALRGIETFLQLVGLGGDGFGVPEVRIADRPRFPWRGLLIDSARHWIPPEVIKRTLDGMAAVKLNVLHWHLTDDQGFRVESRRFPRLPKEGAGGLFYTQGEIREIVALASDRGIRVVPELDMPGHTASWLVGYPELASASGPYRIERTWGGHDATIDPTKEESYRFISELMAELATLFPDRYVHVGGDQVNGKHWKANPKISAFAKERGLDDRSQLQAYFTRRVHEILRRQGKEMIGWDPILHPNLPQNSVIQSVRGQKWLAKAAREGYRVVAGSEYYLDQLESAESYYTSDPFAEEAADLTAEQQGLILGGEASMWTEFSDAENIDARIWPCAAAVAERLWSPREVTDVEDMYRRLSKVSQRLAWIGLTHESGPLQMLRRMTDYRTIEPLRTLANTVRPLFDPRWNNHAYTSLTPLNRLVDATPPDSEIARDFALAVERYLDDPSDEDLHNAVATRLGVWRDNHDALIPCIRHSPLLAEVEPISTTLSQISEVGLRSLQAIRSGLPVSQSDREGDLALLEGATLPSAELEITIVPAIRSLVSATLAVD
ncbi:MAG: family 20 glycosylhydrolase, partial [Thermoanaerobaculia bacterium]